MVSTLDSGSSGLGPSPDRDHCGFWHRHFSCIRQARGTFESTNQDSAGGKKSSVLKSSKQVRKGFEIRQLFSLKMALNIHEKGFTISITIPVCQK